MCQDGEVVPPRGPVVYQLSRFVSKRVNAGLSGHVPHNLDDVTVLNVLWASKRIERRPEEMVMSASGANTRNTKTPRWVKARLCGQSAALLKGQPITIPYPSLPK